MKPSQRLFIKSALNQGAKLRLDADQAHYLINVLRMPVGSEILVFNGKDGEWSAELVSVSKRGGELFCLKQTRAQDIVPELWLAFAPVKGDRVDYIVEKATELGACVIIPIITERTIVRKVNHERLLARCIEAAEQCGRLSVPEVFPPLPLSAFYDQREDDALILFADEAGDNMTIAQSLGEAKPPIVILLTGPEGGFTPLEREKLRGCEHVRPVSLGPRILRADTATFAGLALVQSVWGDWT
jgi:16S rRNA (uracil1498-N3)-methyltransferase